jgi:hypothetical protein
VFVEEGESAKTADRTELQRLLQYCGQNKRLIDFVVVYNLSRFSRETRDHHALAATLAGFGTRLRSATEPIDESPVGRFMESIFASVAQFDNDVKAERSRKTMLAVLEQGRWTFQAPLGYQTGGRVGASLVVRRGPSDDHRRRVRGAGRASHRQVGGSRADEPPRPAHAQRQGALRADGARPAAQPDLRGTRRGAQVEGRGGRRLRADRAARGLRTRAGAARGPQGGRPVAQAAAPGLPLRRFVRCGHCQKPLTGSWTRGRSARYGYYHCTSCGRVRVPRAQLEAAFESLLERLRPDPGFLQMFHAIVLDAWKGREGAARALRAKLERRVAGLREKLDRLDDAFLFRRQIDQASYERQRDRMRQQRSRSPSSS